jgi:hypothetical protein
MPGTLARHQDALAAAAAAASPYRLRLRDRRHDPKLTPGRDTCPETRETYHLGHMS